MLNRIIPVLQLAAAGKAGSHYLPCCVGLQQWLPVQGKYIIGKLVIDDFMTEQAGHAATTGLCDITVNPQLLEDRLPVGERLPGLGLLLAMRKEE